MKKPVLHLIPKSGNGKEQNTEILIYPIENGEVKICLIGGCANFNLSLNETELDWLMSAIGRARE